VAWPSFLLAGDVAGPGPSGGEAETAEKLAPPGPSKPPTVVFASSLMPTLLNAAGSDE